LPFAVEHFARSFNNGVTLLEPVREELALNLHRLTFPKTTEIVVHCKSGARSQRAALILKENGYTNVSNLAGGILAWADRIDKSLPKY
jgi:adenylyltransferase/sulfurtransferase